MLQENEVRVPARIPHSHATMDTYHVIDDGDVERAAGAFGDLLPTSQIILHGRREAIAHHPAA